MCFWFSSSYILRILSKDCSFISQVEISTKWFCQSFEIILNVSSLISKSIFFHKISQSVLYISIWSQKFLCNIFHLIDNLSSLLKFIVFHVLALRNICHVIFWSFCVVKINSHLFIDFYILGLYKSFCVRFHGYCMI